MRCFSLILLLVFSLPVSGVNRNLFQEVMWPSSCKELKKSLSRSHKINLRYQPRPQIDIKGARYWVLQYSGYRIPIPVTKYRHVLVSREQPGYAVILKTRAGGFIMIYGFIDKVSNDVFEGVEGLKRKTTSRGRQLTKDMYGRPPRLSDLLFMGYLYRTDDLSCRQEDYLQGAAIAIPLILKSVGASDHVLKVHRGVGRYPGLFEVMRDGKGRLIYRATLFEPENDRTIQVNWIGVRKNAGTSAGHLAYLLGDLRVIPDGSSRPPVWLDTLNRAIRTGNPDDWKALAIQLEKAGMSKRSIESARKLAAGK